MSPRLIQHAAIGGSPTAWRCDACNEVFPLPSAGSDAEAAQRVQESFKKHLREKHGGEDFSQAAARIVREALRARLWLVPIFRAIKTALDGWVTMLRAVPNLGSFITDASLATAIAAYRAYPVKRYYGPWRSNRGRERLSVNPSVHEPTRPTITDRLRSL